MAVTFVAGLLLLGSSAAAAPPGNNGTVKIHNEVLDSNPYNRPHVSCPFTVTFFGFDEGDVAQVTFFGQPPSGKDIELLTDQVFIGEDDNSGGGSQAGFDGEKTYELDLSGLKPHDQQGFHVKLVVSVTSPGSKTPKYNKFKVFWTEPCEEEETTTSTSTSSTTSTTMAGGGGGQQSSTTVSTVLGAPPQPQGRARLPRTGSNALPMTIVGVVLLAVGAASLLASRRHRQSRA